MQSQQHDDHDREDEDDKPGALGELGHGKDEDNQARDGTHDVIERHVGLPVRSLESPEVLGHPEAGQGEAGEDTNGVERHQLVDVRARAQQQGHRRDGQDHDPVGEGQAVTSFGQPTRKKAVSGNKVCQEWEPVERCVGSGVEDQHRGGLDQQETDVPSHAVSQHRLGDL